MKNTIRSIISLGFLVSLVGIFALSLSAQEFGVDLTTQITIQKPEPNTAQNESANGGFVFAERMDPWFKAPIDSNGSVFEGNAHFGGGFVVDPNAPVGNLIGDIDILRLAFVFPKVTTDGGDMRLEFGRLLVADPTGLIVSHPADGFLLGFDYPSFKLTVNAGYTGLVLRNSSTISASNLDASIAGDTSRLLGTSRLLVQGQIEFPDLFLKQTLNGSFLLQRDLNPTSDLIADGTDSASVPSGQQGGALNTEYATLKLSGPIVSTLFYDAWFSYGFGQTLSNVSDSTAVGGSRWENKPISSFLTGLSLDLYTPSFMDGAFNFRFLAASGENGVSSITEGNTGDVATYFVPLTPITLGTAYSPVLSNLMVAQIGGTIKPFPSIRLQTGLKYLAFFRPNQGASGASGVDGTLSSPWIGQEVDISAVYRLTSDLGLSFNGGLFIPGIDPNGSVQTSYLGNPVQYSIQVALTVGI